MQQLELIPEHGIVCPKCLSVSPNEYLHNLNHSVPTGGTLCTSQYGVTNHIFAAVRDKQDEVLTDRMQRGQDLGVDVDAILKEAKERYP